MQRHGGGGGEESIRVNPQMDPIICLKCFLFSFIFIESNIKDEGKWDLVGNNTVNLKTSASRRQDRNARNTSLYALK